MCVFPFFMSFLLSSLCCSYRWQDSFTESVTSIYLKVNGLIQIMVDRKMFMCLASFMPFMSVCDACLPSYLVFSLSNRHKKKVKIQSMEGRSQRFSKCWELHEKPSNAFDYFSFSFRWCWFSWTFISNDFLNLSLSLPRSVVICVRQQHTRFVLSDIVWDVSSHFSLAYHFTQACSTGNVLHS